VLSVEAASVHQHILVRSGAEYGANVLSRIAAGFDVSAVQYARALRNRQLMVHEVEASLSQVDALLSPSVGIVTPTVTDVNEASPEQLAVLFRQITRWMRLPSYLGLPVVQAPIGTLDGLPVGVQLVGKRGSDVLLSHLAEYL
jgi:Asp-tRNA(Asn)/Glu-tRNA(Gln) amidotransferase A subunit family amidase